MLAQVWSNTCLPMYATLKREGIQVSGQPCLLLPVSQHTVIECGPTHPHMHALPPPFTCSRRTPQLCCGYLHHLPILITIKLSCVVLANTIRLRGSHLTGNLPQYHNQLQRCGPNTDVCGVHPGMMDVLDAAYNPTGGRRLCSSPHLQRLCTYQYRKHRIRRSHNMTNHCLVNANRVVWVATVHADIRLLAVLTEQVKIAAAAAPRETGSPLLPHVLHADAYTHRPMHRQPPLVYDGQYNHRNLLT